MEHSKRSSESFGSSNDSVDNIIPEQRMMTEDEIQEILARQDSRKVTPFMAGKLENEARKNWDRFYKRNETKFFKDRQWTLQEFDEILRKKDPILMEVGCGCGNFIFPMLEKVPELRVLACDFSPRAVDFVRYGYLEIGAVSVYCLYFSNQ